MTDEFWDTVAAGPIDGPPMQMADFRKWAAIASKRIAAASRPPTEITDDMVKRIEGAINVVMEDADVDYPAGYHQGMHRISWDGEAMRKAILAALNPSSGDRT